MDVRTRMIVEDLATAAAENAVAPEAVVSLKFRPVSEPAGPSASNLTQPVYEQLAGQIAFEVDHGAGYHGHVLRQDGRLVIGHETGPEIIALLQPYLEAAGDLVTVIELIGLAVKLIGWLRRMVEHDPAQRLQNARLIRVESRRVAPDGSLTETTVMIVDLARPTDEAALTAALKAALAA